MTGGQGRPDDTNLDPATVEGFGNEWTAFDQAAAPSAEQEQMYRIYFSLFPWEKLPRSAEGFDLGCGSGRWALFGTARRPTLTADSLDCWRLRISAR